MECLHWVLDESKFYDKHDREYDRAIFLTTQRRFRLKFCQTTSDIRGRQKFDKTRNFLTQFFNRIALKTFIR